MFLHDTFLPCLQKKISYIYACACVRLFFPLHHFAAHAPINLLLKQIWRTVFLLGFFGVVRALLG